MRSERLRFVDLGQHVADALEYASPVSVSDSRRVVRFSSRARGAPRDRRRVASRPPPRRFRPRAAFAKLPSSTTRAKTRIEWSLSMVPPDRFGFGNAVLKDSCFVPEKQ
jgi:hypothetical protein